MTRLAFRAAAVRAGVTLRTLRTWRSEGLIVEEQGGRLYVRTDHVLAWKRWKSLTNPAAGYRRARAAAAGEAGAVVKDAQIEKARREWVAAGGGRGESRG